MEWDAFDLNSRVAIVPRGYEFKGLTPDGNNSLQLRGGSDIFTGRIPFVWIGNQAANPGINPGYTFQVDATSENFKFPQVWKTNIAIDRKIKSGWIFGFEEIFGKDINAITHRNYNMSAPVDISQERVITDRFSQVSTNLIFIHPAQSLSVFSMQEQ